MADDGTIATATAAAPVYAPGVSVIVCTYNRRPLLQALVESLRPQLPVAFPLEVLIVDNNSRDDTATYGKALHAEDATFRYVFEGAQGLSHARNAGAGAARYGFLMYLDDDAILPPHYLATLGRRLGEHDPDFFGGPLYPLYLDPKPDWFPESLEVRRKAERSGFDANIVLTGANYGVRRAVLERVGGFDPQYGMTGGKVGMLEERLVIEAYRRLTPAAEQKIWYGLDCFILNQTPAKRMRLRFQLERIFIGNAGFIAWQLKQGVRSPKLLFDRVWRAFVGEACAVLKVAPKLWRERRSAPEEPMLALVKLTYRGADLWGAVSFLLSDFGRTRRRRTAEGAEARPLNLVLFTASRLDGEGRPTAAGDAAELDGLRQAIQGEAELEVVSIEGRSDDQIRDVASAMNLRAVDAMITDSPKAARALAVLRGPRPHIQLLLWLRDPKPLNYLKSPKHLWDKRQGVLARLSRDRALVREVDQTVCPAGWLVGPLARLLLPLRRPVLVSSRTAKGGDAAQKRVSEGWRGVLNAARVWAPRRLAP